jgi:HD superfamily phosphohydrolase
MQRLLKNAALLHDIGHMPFSHVVEGIVEADPKRFCCGPVTVDDFTFEAADCLGKNLKFGECLSLAFILTPRFRRFYERSVDREASPSAVFKIGSMIAGLPPDEGMSGLSGLISGPSIDADKVDYINRDAAACGIPVGVDVARLFLRSSFLSVPPGEMRRLTSSPELSPHDEIIFVVNASGLDSIEEIGQARTTLYHRVYLHQTTRNAERLMSIALYNATSADTAKHRDALYLWNRDDQMLLRELAGASEDETARFGRALLSRRLPKRACAFGRNFARISIPLAQVFKSMEPAARKMVSKEIAGPGLDLLRTKQSVGEKQRVFEQDITEEAAIVADKIRSGGGESPAGKPEFLSVLPMPNLEPNRSDCIVLEHERLNSTAASSISDEQMEAADIAKSTGYVMTESAWREIVLIAARTVLFRRQSGLSDIGLVPYPGGAEIAVKAIGRILLDIDAVAPRVGINSERLGDVMAAADHGGYFENVPRLARDNISDAEIADAIGKFSEFSGQGNWSVSRESVRAFLEQFPTKLRRDVLRLVASFSILDRTSLASATREIIDGFGPASGKRRFIVGLSPDSGNEVRIRLEHELRQALETAGWTFKKSLRDALDEAQADDELVLCDDNVTSGSQAICQFMAWLGVPEADWTVEQRLEQGIERTALSERDKELLKAIDTKIIVAAGTLQAKDALDLELGKLGLKSFKGLHYKNALSRTTTELDSVGELLQDIGCHVLAWARHRATDLSSIGKEQLEACKRDALGYRGARALACTPMNVPAGTVTAFWCPGLYKGDAWIPLLIRRGYLQHLVLAVRHQRLRDRKGGLR